MNTGYTHIICRHERGGKHLFDVTTFCYEPMLEDIEKMIDHYVDLLHKWWHENGEIRVLHTVNSVMCEEVIKLFDTALPGTTVSYGKGDSHIVPFPRG